jgi:hypothetical protein
LSTILETFHKFSKFDKKEGGNTEESERRKGGEGKRERGRNRQRERERESQITLYVPLGTSYKLTHIYVHLLLCALNGKPWERA